MISFLWVWVGVSDGRYGYLRPRVVVQDPNPAWVDPAGPAGMCKGFGQRGARLSGWSRVDQGSPKVLQGTFTVGQALGSDLPKAKGPE